MPTNYAVRGSDKRRKENKTASERRAMRSRNRRGGFKPGEVRRNFVVRPDDGRLWKNKTPTERRAILRRLRPYMYRVRPRSVKSYEREAGLSPGFYQMTAAQRKSLLRRLHRDQRAATAAAAAPRRRRRRRVAAAAPAVRQSQRLRGVPGPPIPRTRTRTRRRR